MAIRIVTSLIVLISASFLILLVAFRYEIVIKGSDFGMSSSERLSEEFVNEVIVEYSKNSFFELCFFPKKITYNVNVAEQLAGFEYVTFVTCPYGIRISR